MKKTNLIIALLLGAVALLPRPAAAGLKVVATVSDLGWIAEQVGGEDVEVSVLCPGHQDPHYLPAKPSLARKMRKADLLVYNGLELEVGWLPLLIDTARNNKVRSGSRGELECALAVQHILDVPTGHVDRSGGDIHPLGNPHYLLDPRHGADIARLMADRMAELDPGNADAYRRRAEDLTARIDAHAAVLKEKAAILDGYPVIVYHQHWEYLLHWLGVRSIGSVEHRPGISPSPRHVEEVTNLGRAEERVFVVAATWDNLKIAGKAAERMEAPLAVIPGALGAAEGGETYLEMFTLIVDRLVAAAEAGQRGPEGTY